MTRRSALSAMLFLAGGCAAPARRDARPIAPDFSLPALDGRTVSLSSLRGRPVVVNFWATWCAPCRVETPWLVDLYGVYRARGVEFLGVSLDEPGQRTAVAAFALRMKIAYPVLLGTRAVADAYGGVPLMPHTFFVARTGVVAHETIGVTSERDLDRACQELLAGSPI